MCVRERVCMRVYVCVFVKERKRVCECVLESVCCVSESVYLRE